MTPEMIFATQLGFSLLVYALLANWLLAGKLAGMQKQDALFWLTLPHVSRHVGLAFLVPGLAAGPLDASFTAPTAYGDFATAILALLALAALRARRGWAISVVWLFNIVGTIDLLKALGNPDAIPNLGANWFIPTMWVPLLLVTHVMIFVRLLKREPTLGGQPT